MRYAGITTHAGMQVTDLLKIIVHNDTASNYSTNDTACTSNYSTQ